jgi:hypothetical protein
MDQQRLLVTLRQILSTRLSEEELRTLCFDLGVDYENLGGESKAAHARELVSYFERRERLDDLISGCRSSLPELPWESLLMGESPRVTSPSTPTPRAGGKVNILFLAANPSDTPILKLDQEVRAMDEALRGAEFRERFELIQHWAVRVGDLETCLLRHRPQIVHFSGHGSSASEIMLENEQGLSQAVEAGALSRLFGLFQEHLRCVVLNACYTADQAEAIAETIDCVIGMSQAIGDEAGRNFSRAFYQALGYGRDVRSAFELGCVQIDLQSLAEGDTPRLLAKRSEPSKMVFV